MSAAEIVPEHVDEALRPEVVMSLDERRDRIIEIAEQAADDIGHELIAAKREHRGEFMAWVQRSLPFGIDKAERLMAIARSFENVDPEIRAALPPRYTALFEFTRIPIDSVVVGIESGAVTPEMTTAEARDWVAEARAAQFGVEPAPAPAPRPVKPGPEPGFDPNPRLTADIVARELLRNPREDLSAPLETLLRAWLDPKETVHDPSAARSAP
jgi:hypothetical protein